MCFAEQPGGCLVGANVPGRCQEAFSPLVQKGHLHSLVLCISNCVCFPRNNVRVSLHHKDGQQAACRLEPAPGVECWFWGVPSPGELLGRQGLGAAALASVRSVGKRPSGLRGDMRKSQSEADLPTTLHCDLHQGLSSPAQAATPADAPKPCFHKTRKPWGAGA